MTVHVFSASSSRYNSPQALHQTRLHGQLETGKSMNVNVYELKQCISKVMALLVEENFDELERLDMLDPASKEGLALEMKDYLEASGEVFVYPPDDEFDKLMWIYLRSDGSAKIEFDFWGEDGRSDLTAIIIVDTKSWKASLYDLHVL
jgi:hypothetical protein